MSSSGPFFDLNTERQAYLLGVVAAASAWGEGWFEIPQRGKSDFVVEFLRSASGDGPLFERRPDALRVFSTWLRQAEGHLVRSPSTRHWTELSTDLSGAFLRGVFDTGGEIACPRKDELSVTLTGSTSLLDDVQAFVASPVSESSQEQRRWCGDCALDLLGQIYGPAIRESTSRPAHPKMLNRARRWMTRIAGIAPTETGAVISVRRLVKEARLPGKERVSDSGYDLTLLYESKRIGDVVLYGTGLVVKPPAGWYFDLVPRSSIIKRGYIVANSIGVIDRSYRGEILVPLIKVDPRAPDLELPARVAQLIPRPIVHFEVIEEALSASHRGEGGFGSTGE